MLNTKFAGLDLKSPVIVAATARLPMSINWLNLKKQEQVQSF